MENCELKPGMILAYCWGYSMTLWDFYKVLKINDKSMILVKLQKQYMGGSQNNMEVKPIDIEVDKPFRRGIKKFMGNLYNPNERYYEDHMD